MFAFTERSSAFFLPLGRPSTDESIMADADFLDELDAIADVLSSSDSSPSRDSKQRKRERNREWMRRARLRKRSQQSEVHSTVAALEIQREALMKERCLDETAVQTLLSKRQDTRAKIAQYRQLNRAYTEVEKALGVLREENFTLREELRRRRVAEAIVRDLVNELTLAADQAQSPRSEVDDGKFQWFDEVQRLYESLSLDSACDLVRESYSEILEYMTIAYDCIPSPHPVFGWNDRRLLDDTWSNFMFDKSFSHQSAFELMRKTWKLSTDALRVRVLQPRSQRLKILQVLNESTLIVARQSYFPSEDDNLCTVYVLFWIETPDHGFVIGTRSIEPYSRELTTKYQALGGHLFTKLVYAFLFTPEAAGCRVAFGGRVDNVQAVHARNCLMDAILAMLRWESHCVAPVLALAS